MFIYIFLCVSICVYKYIVKFVTPQLALANVFFKKLKLRIPWQSRDQQGFPDNTSGTEPAWQCSRCRRCGFDPWVGKIPWRRAWQPTPVFLHGKSHGQRSLAGYSLWSHKRVGQNLVTKHSHSTCESIFSQVY